MTDRVLMVDDDPDILEGYKRRLRKEFTIDTAIGPELGLEIMARQGPYAVVVSDLRMPGMDGVEFLTRVRRDHSEAIRVMFTGAGDAEMGMNAINQELVYRFLIKPCTHEVLSQVLRSCLRQYRLLQGERELLGKTFVHMVRVLSDVVTSTSPDLAAQIARRRRLVSYVAGELKSALGWQCEIAMMLTTILQGTKVRVHGVRKSGLAVEPLAVVRLLGDDPRLTPIARMLDEEAGRNEDEDIRWGRQLLRVVSDYDRRRQKGSSPDVAIAEMRQEAEHFDAQIIQALEMAEHGVEEGERKEMKVKELEDGMILDQDVQTGSGDVVLMKGHEVSPYVRAGLANLDIVEPIHVRIPLRGKELIERRAHVKSG